MEHVKQPDQNAISQQETRPIPQSKWKSNRRVKEQWWNSMTLRVPAHHASWTSQHLSQALSISCLPSWFFHMFTSHHDLIWWWHQGECSSHVSGMTLELSGPAVGIASIVWIFMDFQLSMQSDLPIGKLDSWCHCKKYANDQHGFDSGFMHSVLQCYMGLYRAQYSRYTAQVNALYVCCIVPPASMSTIKCASLNTT